MWKEEDFPADWPDRAGSARRANAIDKVDDYVRQINYDNISYLADPRNPPLYSEDDFALLVYYELGEESAAILLTDPNPLVRGYVNKLPYVFET